MKTGFRIVGKALLSLALLIAGGLFDSYLFDSAGFGGHNIGEEWLVRPIIVFAGAVSLFYLWATTARRGRARETVRGWLAREWRLIPFYLAAVLLSLAALRYILSN